MDAPQARNATPRPVTALPGPRGLPLLGHALLIEPARFHQQLEQWAQTFGPAYKLRFGRRDMLVISDHETVAAVLRDRPEGFRRSALLETIWLELGLPIGLFGAEGETWARQRRMVMAGFDPAHVCHYLPTMLTVAEHLATRWRSAAQAGQAIDLQADLMRFTVDTIAGLAFGEAVNTLGAGPDVIQQHLDQIFPALNRRLLAPLPMWRFLPSHADRELRRSVSEVKAAVADFIASARARLQAEPARRARPDNLLEAMIVAADSEGSGIDDAQVAGNVLTLLLAGEDTTANTLAWLIHLLWLHPRALARARDELRCVLPPGEGITPERLAALDYLEACAFEAMRLKPVAPLLVVQALRDATIGSVQVDSDQVVFCLLRRDSVSEVHMLRAASFEPERWLQGAPTSEAKRIAMPFGAGPRICPGRYLALLEIKLAMATLLGQFEIQSVDTPDGAEARERLSFTMAPQGLTMRLSMAARKG